MVAEGKWMMGSIAYAQPSTGATQCCFRASLLTRAECVLVPQMIAAWREIEEETQMQVNDHDNLFLVGTVLSQ